LSPEFQHDGVYNGDRCGRERDAGEPAGISAPANQKAGYSRATEEWSSKRDETHDRRLLPLPSHDLGIQLCPGQECENHGPGAGEEFDPGLIRAQYRCPERRPDDELRNDADDDFGHCGGNAQPDRQQRGDERQPEP